MWRAFELRWNSLKTRVTLLVLAIAVVGYAALAIYAGYLTRLEVKQTLAMQQFATVSLVASDVNEALSMRLQALEDLAGTLTPATGFTGAAAQAALSSHPTFARLFNDGIVAINAQATVVADVPPAAQRIGLPVGDRDYARASLERGTSAISAPLVGKKSGHPIVVISVPIRDAQERVVGALAGVTDLGAPNFLDRITANRFGTSGDTFVVTPQNRMIVSTSDKKRLLEVLPGPGVSAWIDRFADGFEGSATVVNPHGVEVLVSVKQVPIAGWYTSVIISTDEALAGLRQLRHYVLMILLPLATLMLGALIWWTLRWQLTPLMGTTRKLTALARSDAPLQPLPVTRHDEVGALIGSFNQLLQTLAQRQQALLESEGRFRALADNAPALVWMADADARYTYFNRIWLNFTGRMLAQEVGPDGHGWLQGVHPQDAQRRLDTTGHAFAAQLAFSVDYRLRRADGVYRWLTDHGVPRHDEQGVFLGFIGTCIDITERMEHANQLEQIAHFDSLTGLPNRTLLADRLHQALAGAQRRGQLLAVVFLDLDGFKAINDAHGHEAGDLVLVTVARRMKQVLRGVDTLARLGGDEFVAVLADLFDRQSCVPMLDRVLEAAAEPVPFGGVTLQVTASAGVTFYPQSHDVTADQLLRQADQAMYQAKLAGKNRYHFFQ